jgi:hypothetical protein
MPISGASGRHGADRSGHDQKGIAASVALPRSSSRSRRSKRGGSGRGGARRRPFLVAATCARFAVARLPWGLWSWGKEGFNGGR